MGLVCDIIQKSEYDKVVELAVEVFMEDKYFLKHLPDAKFRRKELAKIYRDGLEICANNFGNTLVARKDGEGVGFLMFFDYVKFRASNLEDFKKVFGIEIQHNHVLPASFAKIHKTVLKSHNNPIYVLAIGVGKKYQHQGVGKTLFMDFLNRFDDRAIMSDISGAFFLRLCRKYGFHLEQISDVCYLGMKMK